MNPYKFLLGLVVMLVVSYYILKHLVFTTIKELGEATKGFLENPEKFDGETVASVTSHRIAMTFFKSVLMLGVLYGGLFTLLAR